jgi:hypothetical protein
MRLFGRRWVVTGKRGYEEIESARRREVKSRSDGSLGSGFAQISTQRSGVTPTQQLGITASSNVMARTSCLLEALSPSPLSYPG